MNHTLMGYLILTCEKQRSAGLSKQIHTLEIKNTIKILPRYPITKTVCAYVLYNGGSQNHFNPSDDYNISDCFGRPFNDFSVYCHAVDAKYS
jgi:hypothetical protein